MVEPENEELQLYTIDINYVRYLWTHDTEVFFDELRADIYGRKPYVGILIAENEFKYFVPLTSAKLKHSSWSPVSKYSMLVLKAVESDESMAAAIYKTIENNKYQILAALDFRKMIPVKDGLFSKIDIETIEDEKYRDLLRSEYQFLRPKWRIIVEHSANLYRKQLETGFPVRCGCNFRNLEKACIEYCQSRD